MELQLESQETDKLEEMKEMVKESDRLIEEKTKELLVVQADNEKQLATINDQHEKIEVWQRRCKEMEDQMRRFTSLGQYGENDETFESVLRAEFEVMRSQYEKQVTILQSQIQQHQTDQIRMKTDFQSQIEKLKVLHQALSNRLIKSRLQKKD